VSWSDWRRTKQPQYQQKTVPLSRGFGRDPIQGPPVYSSVTCVCLSVHTTDGRFDAHRVTLDVSFAVIGTCQMRLLPSTTHIRVTDNLISPAGETTLR